jgi:hypothetical protein
MPKIKVFVTGDAEKCPFCGRKVVGNDPSTHHVDEVDTEKLGEKIEGEKSVV